MAIHLLRIADFRNIESASFAPLPCGLNIICGMNGSGKTSVLEAIHYLGVGRSFRSSLATRLIRQHTDKFSIYSQVVSDNERQVPLGVERDIRGNTALRANENNNTTVIDVASFLPIRIINSQSHHLFESGPVFRRKYLDWGLFYQSESFLSCWRQYDRALRQRNTLLREKRTKSELDAWTEELIKHGLEFDRLRREYVQQLTPFIAQTADELLDFSNLEINYQAGWNEAAGYAETLAAHFTDELRLGHTQYGPHRADLDITLNDVAVKHILSRGQQKLLICAMITAQGMLLAQQANKGLVYLIDDLPSELDLQSRMKLIALLSKQKSQVFITAIEKESICELVKETEVGIKVFHVEHGDIREWQ